MIWWRLACQLTHVKGGKKQTQLRLKAAVSKLQEHCASLEVGY